jgi:transglutaminase/protease-like cytokinesis protein 3
MKQYLKITFLVYSLGFLILLLALSCDKTEYYIPVDQRGEVYQFDSSVTPGVPEEALKKINILYIDEKISFIPSAVGHSMIDLTKYFKDFSLNDAEKAYFVYKWVSENITYDFRENITWENQSSDSVFLNRKAVCTGYSQLFANLAKRTGLNVVRIIGFAKGITYKPGNIFEKENHVWNAIEIDKKWFLVDATWGAGHANSSGIYVKDFDANYFLVQPEIFIQKHFPTDEKWQLLKRPLSKEEFESATLKNSSRYFTLDDFILGN